MGELAQSLLQTLGAGGGGGIAPGGPTSPIGVVPPEGGMTEGVMGFPSVMRGGINETGALPTGGINETGVLPAGGMTDEMTAVVNGFKPKKISFWGALGDQLMKHWGNDPVFSKRIEQKNLRRAMKGFTTDPVEAIRRIAQIPGMEKEAWGLLNTMQDNTRADAAQSRLMGKDRESVINRSLGLLRTIKEDGSNYDAVRQVWDGIMSRNDIKDAPLPSEFDPELIGAQAASGMTMNQHAMDEYRRANLARQNRNTDSQISHRQVQEQQGATRLDQGQQRLNQDVIEERGRDKRDLTPTPKSDAPRVVDIRDSQGNIRRLIVKGNIAASKLPDGRQINYIVQDGKYIPVGIKEPKK